MSPDALVPGARLRVLRGHHPGAIVEVVRTYGRQVEMRPLKPRSEKPMRLLAAHVMRNMEPAR